ncbi:hypothetical protein LR48_Vigan01g204100 [Vigna angularis]|uniref:Secreted protein n=1 Tax=Phaseolus angularis TaxID=3914 RepID=A0A0L9TPL8_PHAAN|nr:hypothetical protein LR48_Vigan01g204100 [Vigna angularis]
MTWQPLVVLFFFVLIFYLGQGKCSRWLNQMAFTVARGGVRNNLLGLRFCISFLERQRFFPFLEDQRLHLVSEKPVCIGGKQWLVSTPYQKQAPPPK